MSSKSSTLSAPTPTSAKSGAPSKAKPIPEGMRTLTPHLVCNGAAEAIEFYKKAFNAEEIMRLPTPGGKLMHACMRIGDSAVMLTDEWPEQGALGPTSLKGTPVTLHLYVDDADAAFQQAVQAGAKVVMPIADMFWGDRYGIVADPCGHHWSIATHQRDLTPEQIAEAAQQFGCGGPA